MYKKIQTKTPLNSRDLSSSFDFVALTVGQDLMRAKK